jgi:sodium/potassium/calcium exchanger 2
LDAIIVESDSLNFSLVLLIVMLVSVVGIIALCGWRMTNGLGMAMLVLYGIFLTLVIMQSQGVIGGF